ncbi:pollen allergen Lol p 2-A-like [Lolium rigidum]|uniref:pollen allergen Lol p 2-A-like n=1 Tax=Lolium rigidum TaxID=89674 RepID=UPI001F5D6CC7|nr:pollen allergen Lol p 2-A-like [Lolium rigidum]
MAFSPGCLLVAAVLAAVLAGAWCAPPSVTFTVDKGSNEKNMALQIKCSKEGDAMKAVELKEHTYNKWLFLNKGAGGVWQVKSDKPLKGPFNFRFVTEKGMKNVFNDVVPANFKVGTTYAPKE